jgi:hypothetical protein
MAELRYQVYLVQVHDFCDKCAIWIEPDDPSQEIPGYNYVTRAEMDAAKGYLESDETQKTWTNTEVLDVIKGITSVNDSGLEWLAKVADHFFAEDEKLKASVKFFGEMQWSGHQFTSQNRDTGHGSHDFAHICINPACKFEKVSPVQYPYTTQVEGRIAHNPSELSLEDKIIQEKMKNHVGSSVTPESEVK